MARDDWYDAARWSMLAGDHICKPKDIVKLDLSGYSAYEALEKITETTGCKIEVKENEMEIRCGNCKYRKVSPNCEPCKDCVMSSHFVPERPMVDYTANYVSTGVGITNTTFKAPETKYHLEGLIKNVIFNDPATIVFWTDNTKTVVKCQEGDVYDPEKGLAMAICKKVMGNQGNYCNVFKKWVPEKEEECPRFYNSIDEWKNIGDGFAEGIRLAMARMGGETYKVHRDNLMVTAATRAVYMEADMDLVVLPTGVEGEAELAKFIAESVDAYLDADKHCPGEIRPFDIYIEEVLKIKYGVKNDD